MSCVIRLITDACHFFTSFLILYVMIMQLKLNIVVVNNLLTKSFKKQPCFVKSLLFLPYFFIWVKFITIFCFFFTQSQQLYPTAFIGLGHKEIQGRL